MATRSSVITNLALSNRISSPPTSAGQWSKSTSAMARHTRRQTLTLNSYTVALMALFSRPPTVKSRLPLQIRLTVLSTPLSSILIMICLPLSPASPPSTPIAAVRQVFPLDQRHGTRRDFWLMARRSLLCRVRSN